MPSDGPAERGVLPSPAGDGVYHFTEDLWRLHEAQAAATTRSEPAADAEAIVALEPHPDDLALSIAGRLIAEPRPLCVVSVFSEAGTAHPASSLSGAPPHQVAAVRRAENRAALAAVGAEIIELGMEDASKPYRPASEAKVSDLVALLEERFAEIPTPFELLAPAAVTRHPDHVLVHQAARRLGCRWFWEDVSFFPTYGRSVEDRRWFEDQRGAYLDQETFDITETALAKVAMLANYVSQAPSPAEVCGVLRYAWAVAAEEGSHGRFAERSYRLR